MSRFGCCRGRVGCIRGACRPNVTTAALYGRLGRTAKTTLTAGIAAVDVGWSSGGASWRDDHRRLVSFEQARIAFEHVRRRSWSRRVWLRIGSGAGVRIVCGGCGTPRSKPGSRTHSDRCAGSLCWQSDPRRALGACRRYAGVRRRASSVAGVNGGEDGGGAANGGG